MSKLQNRRRLAVVVLLASVCLALLPPRVDAGRPSGPQSTRQGKSVALARVRYIKRGLAVQPPSQPFVKGKKNMPLYNRYLVRTRKQQMASLGFGDGSVLHLNQQTDAVLRSQHLTYVKKGEDAEIVAPGTGHRVQA